MGRSPSTSTRAAARILSILSFVSLAAAPEPGSSGGAVLRLPIRISPDWPWAATEDVQCPAPGDATPPRPVIGIVSHPGDGASGRLNNRSSASYIAASYVKFAESAGARVVPLIYNEPEEVLVEKLRLVNGVIFTGGWCKEGLYFDTINKILQIVLEKNEGGDTFPLLAICLGFELVSMIVGQDNNILERFRAANQASSLQFPSYGITEGTVFERFPSELLQKLSTDCLVMQNHRYGVAPKKFRENKYLSSFFKLLTTTPDRDGKIYVSSIQAYKYPVVALQWHPEKTVYEWGSRMIPHSQDAIQVSQNVANYFISKAHKSSNRPSDEELIDKLIYNYKPVYSAKSGSEFQEVYIFS